MGLVVEAQQPAYLLRRTPNQRAIVRNIAVMIPVPLTTTAVLALTTIVDESYFPKKADSELRIHPVE
ncbi:hypothetical protein ACRQ5Q_41890 (plasmid) [Bradyrhizobium sp. PMVTL-01]|uniref:hypothetical protein n=1 Tax=Bradyrhizobium sp. PMVTL-01 TaxID=3434999 RepID=UPI003F714BF8